MAHLLRLDAARSDREDSMTDLVLHRLEQKCERLANRLPMLSHATVQETIAQACAISNWHALVRKIATPGCFREIPTGRWSVVETLPAAMDAGNATRPLTDGQRVYARHFSRRLANALVLELPEAYDLAARLYGAKNWLTLVGEVPPIAPDEVLYTYEEPATDSGIGAFLRPSRGCARLTAELVAITRFADADGAAHAARYALARRPEFLTATHIAVDALLSQGADAEALHYANRALGALKSRILPVSARLDPSRVENIDYYRVRCSRVIALTRLERFNDAAHERDGLVAELKAFAISWVNQVASWLSDGDTDLGTGPSNRTTTPQLPTWRGLWP